MHVPLLPEKVIAINQDIRYSWSQNRLVLVFTSHYLQHIVHPPALHNLSLDNSAVQVLRRVSAWLDSEELQRRQQQQQQQNEQQEQGQRQRALHSIQEQIDRMALELERLETKMDLKMDRLQEVSRYA